jgi:thioredoxin 1
MSLLRIILLIISNFGFYAVLAQESIKPKDLIQKLFKKEAFYLIDIRTESQMALGHIRKSMHIEILEEPKNETLNLIQKSAEIVVYGQSGQDGLNAAVQLKDLGFEKVYFLEGGFESWVSSSLPYLSLKENAEALSFYSVENFNNLKARPGDKIIQFYASWCSVCKSQKKQIEKYVSEDSSIKFIRIDAEKNKSLAEYLEIEAVPVLLIIKNQKQIWRKEGKIDASELSPFFD